MIKRGETVEAEGKTERGEERATGHGYILELDVPEWDDRQSQGNSQKVRRASG